MDGNPGFARPKFGKPQFYIPIFIEGERDIKPEQGDGRISGQPLPIEGVRVI